MEVAVADFHSLPNHLEGELQTPPRLSIWIETSRAQPSTLPLCSLFDGLSSISPQSYHLIGLLPLSSDPSKLFNTVVPVSSGLSESLRLDERRDGTEASFDSS